MIRQIPLSRAALFALFISSSAFIPLLGRAVAQWSHLDGALPDVSTYNKAKENSLADYLDKPETTESDLFFGDEEDVRVVKPLLRGIHHLRESGRIERMSECLV